MTELTNTPERQSSERMDSDPDAGDIRPDRGRRSRRRRWYLLAVIPVVLLTLVVIRIASLPMHGCTLVGIYPEPDSGVSFRLAPVLANAAMPVHVRACVPSSCASITVRNWSVGLFKGRGVWERLVPGGLKGGAGEGSFTHVGADNSPTNDG
jgi:hypothetical protein